MNNVVITGASGDIGKAIAREYAHNGYNLALLYHTDEESAKSLYKEFFTLGCIVKIYQCDLTDEKSVNAAANSVLRDFGDDIDVVVNNAGVSKSGLITDFSANDFDRIFGVNVKGMFMLNNLLIPSMIHQKKGAIINVSSMWGRTGASCEVLYSASKSAVIGYTKALAKELGPSGIRVNCVAPGFIDTKMNSEYTDDDKRQFVNDLPVGRLGTPEDVAAAVMFLSQEYGYITGQVLGVDGGAVI